LPQAAKPEDTMTRLLATALAALIALPAAAQTPATAEAIRATIIGNTVQGGMSDGTAYTEFYATDGTIRGKDYTGAWTLEGDRMCFAYGEAPTCFGVAIAGDQVTWLGEAGPAGTGTVVAGNPNGY
jgi:hypothetical protein